MLKRKILLPSPLSSLLLLSACATTPPDVPACQDLSEHIVIDQTTGHEILTPSPACEAAIGEISCGHCVYIVSGKEIYIGEKAPNLLNGKPWSQVVDESVYLPAEESYAPLSTYIINSCKKMNCNDEIDKFKIKLDSLNGLF